jgi:transcriptional regulator with XRE-family HTH domain
MSTTKAKKVVRRQEERAGLAAALKSPPAEQAAKTASQQCLLDLRRNMGVTQERLAALMHKSLVTIARWETSRPPTAASVYELMVFAERHGQREIARRLADIIAQAADPRAAQWGAFDREISFASVTQNLSRNRHVRRAWRAYKGALRRLLDAHALLVEAAHAGASLHEDTPLDALEYDQSMMERMCRDAEEEGQ